jgi:hypothetical protein
LVILAEFIRELELLHRLEVAGILFFDLEVFTLVAVEQLLLAELKFLGKLGLFLLQAVNPALLILDHVLLFDVI